LFTSYSFRSFQVGDMISVIDMPPPEESVWWRGKRGFEVGFFPCDYVEVIGGAGGGVAADKMGKKANAVSSGAAHGGGSDGSDDADGSSSSASSNADNGPTKPVLRKHGKLISFFRSFILSRPQRGRLKKSGILRERVFGCDLSEHLMTTGEDGERETR